jgi:TBC1 domain family member 8/9
MYGTLLDQRVFESLVEKTMPIIWDHLTKNDVQLSVVSLPWFLSLYINSMPLIFAFRVLDVFFLEGPKVLFQVGLAILRINGEELLDATDDGTFISVLKSYFARLGESAHPKSENPKHRAITNFQALMVVAFKEFDGITQHTIEEQRSRHKAAVLESIESFAKRTSIRNLGPESKKLSANDLGFLYDRFYAVLYERQQRAQMIQAETERRQKAAKARGALDAVSGGPIANAPEMGRVALGAASTTTMDYDAFREFLAGIAKWAVTDSPSSPAKDADSISQKSGNSGYFASMRNRGVVSLSPWGSGPEPADHDFLQRLFGKWDQDGQGSLTLQNVVYGLAPIKGGRDIMSSISYFFELYDDDGDGRVDREGILRMSEGLLFLSRRGLESGVHGTFDSVNNGATKDEQFLSAVSAFIRRCFEYADPDHNAQPEDAAASAESVAKEVDLLDLKQEDGPLDPGSDPLADAEEGSKPVPPYAKEDSLLSRPSTNTFGQTSSTLSSPTTPKHAQHNAALDPSLPVHIKLPTFRMLVLADETLESFFDSGFANSFHLADAPLPSSTVTSPAYLSVPGANIASSQGGGLPAISPGGAGAGIVGPGGKGQGLRGVLDNIVTDGMRVAAEVKRRMDEAQKELDRGGSTRGTEHEDDDEEEPGDLLEGAEANAGGGGTTSGAASAKSVDAASRDLSARLPPPPSSSSPGAGAGPAGEGAGKSTMFER